MLRYFEEGTTCFAVPSHCAEGINREEQYQEDKIESLLFDFSTFEICFDAAGGQRHCIDCKAIDKDQDKCIDNDQDKCIDKGKDKCIDN